MGERVLPDGGMSGRERAVLMAMDYFERLCYNYAMPQDLQTIRQAARIVGVGRNAVGRWFKLGLLAGHPCKVGHLSAVKVSVSAVRALSKTRRAGRPKSQNPQSENL